MESSLPFDASFDALAFIVKRLRQGKDQEWIAVLSHCYNSHSWDDQGTIQSIPYEHFDVHWCKPDDVADYQQFDVMGWRILVHPISIERMIGKRLELNNAPRVRPDKATQDDEKVLVPAKLS